MGDPVPVFNEEEHNERALFNRWISEGWSSLPNETDGYPFWSYFDNIASWWKYRHLPNIMFIHFQDMKEDLAGSLRKISAFLGISLPEEKIPGLLDALSFEGMKKEAHCVPFIVFKGGHDSFINKGTNGRWRDILSPEQIQMYDDKVREKFSPELAAWAAGGIKAYDPKSKELDC